MDAKVNTKYSSFRFPLCNFQRVCIQLKGRSIAKLKKMNQKVRAKFERIKAKEKNPYKTKRRKKNTKTIGNAPKTQKLYLIYNSIFFFFILTVVAFHAIGFAVNFTLVTFKWLKEYDLTKVN